MEDSVSGFEGGRRSYRQSVDLFGFPSPSVSTDPSISLLVDLMSGGSFNERSPSYGEGSRVCVFVADTIGVGSESGGTLDSW